MKKTFLIVVLSFWQASASTGGTVGNGGDLVVCRDPQQKIISTELLDYYEARTLRGIIVELKGFGTPENIAVSSLDFFRSRQGIRSARYEKTIREFSDNARFVPGADLVDIPDSDHLIVPTGCKIEQLIIQQTPRFPEDKRYIVNLDLWNAMNEYQKAGAMIHEAIYTEALEKGHGDSRKTRYFHSKILEKRKTEFSDREFIELITMMGFQLPDYRWFARFVGQGLRFNYDDRGRLLRMELNGSQLLPKHELIGDGPTDGFTASRFSTANVRFSYQEDNLDFYEVSINQGSNFSYPLTLKEQSITLSHATAFVRFHSDESIQFSNLVSPAGGKCYREPFSGIEYCGEVWIKKDGSVIPRYVKDLQFSGWTFDNFPELATYRLIVAEQLGYWPYVYNILGASSDSRARYSFAALNLVFNDFEILGFTRDHFLPTTSGVETLPLAEGSTFLGLPFAKPPVLVPFGTRLREGQIVFGLDQRKDLYAAYSAQESFLFPFRDQQILSKYWQQNGATTSIISERMEEFVIQTKRLKSKPQTYISIQNDALKQITLASNHPNVQLRVRGENGLRTFRRNQTLVFATEGPDAGLVIGY